MSALSGEVEFSEPVLFARYLASEMPEAHVAILYAPTVAGGALVRDFHEAVRGTDAVVVAWESYEGEPDLRPLLERCRKAGADALVHFVDRSASARAVEAATQLGWSPFHLRSSALGRPSSSA